ncbi:zinc ribbon domain-containing protein [Paenibacillus monticola]|uniref:zinc ribbon domain-containing protein n=1 Tax=Paenibacillus monticola TaxID=2666075 RepID=UPI003B83905F
MNPNSRRNIFPQSGLLYCEKCGCRMQFRVGQNKKQGQYWSALCYHYYKNGSKWVGYWFGITPSAVEKYVNEGTTHFCLILGYEGILKLPCH